MDRAVGFIRTRPKHAADGCRDDEGRRDRDCDAVPKASGRLDGRIECGLHGVEIPIRVDLAGRGRFEPQSEPLDERRVGVVGPM